MQLGAIFPQTEIGADPAGVRDFAQAAEDLGYEHLLVFDHVLGRRRQQARIVGAPLQLGGYVPRAFRSIRIPRSHHPEAGVRNRRAHPQPEQTALVAKQAAEVDVLTGGRLRLGIGVGWNDVEYEGLNEDFTNRGRRSAEQIEVMRMLWTQDVVDFHGRYHNITHAGINPRPAKSIPVWFGGGAPQVVRRIGRMGDGWFPQFQPDGEGAERIAEMRQIAVSAGRNPDDIGIEGRIGIATDAQDDWGKLAEDWANVGATHLSVNTMRAGLKGPDQHIEAIRRFKETVS